ncbi:MAG: molybdenum cofactor guanylyltransferase [Tenuifilaceae bacterium]|jgi:molybdopterin-guanine dinucleotide biosynthesis protein A|nr:molybdenum cofactor guanylyltransferase [Bacteroidales bacterium]MDI9517284.1 molybdenum cofactor guanylyltransferase [Bacteroidota bacterium]OQC62790.1 MAG: Molybdenum cofactor guanylyltransferase [Bacteroidetes bacterium ADurb.Bin008]HNV81882.1 molybdenum cofactor guanylyltransferase [Tenuifilaceae bacterium]MZP83025.1 NTP transferase domain-containing protein [Bacteroidales bacterium]
MVSKPNYLIIGSTGRNTGKTEFACRLIEKYSKTYPVVGVKVVSIDPDEGNCPRGGKGCGVCTSLKGNFEIFEEKEIDPTKDTSRMLLAGAEKVYFLKVDKHRLKEGLEALMSILPTEAMVLLESNSIRKVIEPGLFLVIKNLKDKRVKDSCAEVIEYADKIIEFDNMSWNFSPSDVHIKNNTWITCENATAIVLAGGKSSRMGEDKSMLSINGIPLIQHIINQLEGHFSEVIIGANDVDRYAFLGKRVIPDIEQGKGPLMGIYSCLRASNTDLNFITACDIPEMNIRMIKRMLNLSVAYDIVMPCKGDAKHEPLFAVYQKSIIPMAEKILHTNKRRIVELMDLARVKLVEFDGNGWYQNLNLMEEYIFYVNKEKERKCYRELLE